MKYKHLSLALLFLILLLNSPLSHLPARAANQVQGAVDLVVDFTNAESRSISVRLGSADGITAEMNFAVLDSARVQIAEFYPHEILVDRFWSGPLEKEAFSRVNTGARVIRIELDREQADILREQVQNRLVLLGEEKRRKRLDSLRENLLVLEDGLNELDVKLFHLNSGLSSLRDQLVKEKDRIQRQVSDIQDRVDGLRDERAELAERRAKLLDKRQNLLRQKDPPRERINDINGDIADIDLDIRQINLRIDEHRDEIRDLRNETSDIREKIVFAQDERRGLDLTRQELVLEKKAIEREIGSLLEGMKPWQSE